MNNDQYEINRNLIARNVTINISTSLDSEGLKKIVCAEEVNQTFFTARMYLCVRGQSIKARL